VPEATTQKLVRHARTWCWLVSLAILCSLNAVAGDLSNYPFSIDSEETPFGHRIVAVNAGPAPVTAKVSLVNSQYIKTSREFPLYVVVPPNGGTLFLGDIRRAMEKVGYTFRLKYEWVLGDMHAVQAPDARYRMPFRDGTTYQITQAPGGPITTHTKPDSQFAIDIPMPEGTPLVAARAGMVIYTESGQVYGAKRPDMLGKANEVKILHSDGTIASYAHLAYGGVHVYPGQRVEEGQQIGLAGSTGYSSGPHLHFAVHTVRRIGDKVETVSLPFQFYVGNPAISFSPQFGMTVTANYSTPGVFPGAQASAAGQPAAPQSAPAAGISITVHPDILAVKEKLQSNVANWGLYHWAGLVGFLVILLMYRSHQAEKRRQTLRSMREPTL